MPTAATLRARQPADPSPAPAASRQRLAERLPRAFASTERLSWEDLRRAPVRIPRPSRLDAEVHTASARVRAGLQALGIRCVRELLEHLPRDQRLMRPIGDLRPGDQATVAAEVRSIASRPVIRRRGRRGRRAGGPRSVLEAQLRDDSGTIRAAFFNQPWLVRRYTPGARLLLHGKVDARRRLQVWSHALEVDAAGAAGTGRPQEETTAGSAPDAPRVRGEGQSGGVPREGEGTVPIPHYPAAEGVTSTQLASLLRAARPALAQMPEPLPGRVLAREALPDRAGALAALHFPNPDADPEPARRRLAFEELLLTQLVFLLRRARRRAQGRAPELDRGRQLTSRWLARGLPFELTRDQRVAIAEIEADLVAGRPMQRLLIGEVGAGKTVVALHAMLRAAENGHQAVLMAPTETLAEQHLATLHKLLAHEQVAVALLSGSTAVRARRRLLAGLADGTISIVVGTHALLEPDVRFRSLALAVVDEQHRFGVRQRVELEGKGADGRRPHTLHMTATPIPRTLALAGYGDLDVSTLAELPQGRKAVRTEIVSGGAARKRAYAALREELAAGRQAYVVCPLVDEPDEDCAPATRPGAAADRSPAPGSRGPVPAGDPAGDALAPEATARAARAELESLRQGELAGFRLALMHGQMHPKEKQAAMAAFVAGDADVLVATTVIEVGVDVPNASVMLVENAERFGISQLHQLRGRIGRGEHPSVCFLMSAAGPAGSGRLRALAEHADGFRLAEIDLALRGRGELVGTRQSGRDLMRVARLPADADLLERARSYAELIVESDPELRAPEHALLCHALGGTFGSEVLAPIPA